MPTAAERTPGTASVTTRRPPGRTVRRTVPPPPSSLAIVRVVPARWSRSRAATSGVGRLGGGSRGVGSDGLARRGGVAVDGSGLVLLDHRDERQLAPRVDLGDL